MLKYFGTDGFRGEANKVLSADHAYKIGRYLGWYYNRVEVALEKYIDGEMGELPFATRDKIGVANI